MKRSPILVAGVLVCLALSIPAMAYKGSSPLADVFWWDAYLFSTLGTGDPVTGQALPTSSHRPLNRDMFRPANVSVAPSAVGASQLRPAVYLASQVQQPKARRHWLDLIALTPGVARGPGRGWNAAVGIQLRQLGGTHPLLAGTDTLSELPDPAGTSVKWSTPPLLDGGLRTAYEIATVPEPPVVALFGLGMFAMWQRYRRR